MSTSTRRLGRGERAPDFVLPCQDGTLTRFYAKAGGRPAVLVFYDADTVDGLRRFAALLNDYTAGTVALFAVACNDAAMQQKTCHAPEALVPIFSDTQGTARAAYHLAAHDPSRLFVLDANLRVLASLDLQDADATAHQVMAVLDAFLPQVDPLEITTQAPVLLIPHVLDPESCQELLDVWETRGNVATGVEQSHQEQRQDTINPEIKRRRDHTVMDADLLRRLSVTIGRRLMPEVYKAFAFRATRFEGFKIACYDATTGGFFRPHRDNLSPATAHRRFALSLNLNRGYAGGYLRFPEYGPHLYRPDVGEALVFSCAHLHEVTEVTQERRFVLLSFLFGEGDVRTTRAPSQDSAAPAQR